MTTKDENLLSCLKTASHFIGVNGLIWISLVVLCVIELTTENLVFKVEEYINSEHINQIYYESLSMETTSEIFPSNWHKNLQ